MTAFASLQQNELALRCLTSRIAFRLSSSMFLISRCVSWSPRTSSSLKFNCVINSGWKTTLLTSICFVWTSVYLAFSPHGTMLMALIGMSVYGCSRMLDGLVSSPLLLIPKFQPIFKEPGATIELRDIYFYQAFNIFTSYPILALPSLTKPKVT